VDAGSARRPAAWTRPLRRLFRPFLTSGEKARLAAEIAAQERLTTGAITVLVLARAGRHDIVHLAEHLFVARGLDRTPNRNGVLIVVTHLDHRFAIWGDAGIAAATDATRWNAATRALLAAFAERRYADGIVACVGEIGAVLARAFPAARTASV